MFTRKELLLRSVGTLWEILSGTDGSCKTTAKALCDLIEEGHQVVVVHGNGPQVGMINNAMSALSREDENQPNTPLSVCVAMSQAYIGYDLQNALREELRIRGFVRTPVVTVVTQVRVDPNDPAFENPSKPIGKFLTKEEADHQAKAYGHIMKEDAGRGYRRVVASQSLLKSLNRMRSTVLWMQIKSLSAAVAAEFPLFLTDIISKVHQQLLIRIMQAVSWPKSWMQICLSFLQQWRRLL